MNNVIDFPEVIPDEPLHQEVFDEVMGHYNDGIEPLENWTSEDLLRLRRALDAELQTRYDNSPNGDAQIEAITDDYS